jgi:hypothetical protein
LSVSFVYKSVCIRPLFNVVRTSKNYMLWIS